VVVVAGRPSIRAAEARGSLDASETSVEQFFPKFF
jgi:hypothetical protein